LIVSQAVKVEDVPAASAVEPTPENLLLRLAVEQFLAEEANLLDTWHLKEWLDLFTPDAQYIVPATDCADADPLRAMVYINDDFPHLEGRVKRLMSRHAHREFPSSRTRRLITNVRLISVSPEEVGLEASFIVYRTRNDIMAPFVGLYRYTLRRLPQGRFQIRYRRAELDHERINDHAAISIIL
jgi:p-cumate 2,3-dioxygenase beta subunit